MNLVRVQASTLPDQNIGKRIIDRLDRIEEEIRKPKPRWGVILATALALLGFVADLKTIDATVYSDSYRTVSQIVSVLYQDGSVLATKAKTLLLSDGGASTGHQDEPQNPTNMPDDNPVALPSKRDEEDES